MDQEERFVETTYLVIGSRPLRMDSRMAHRADGSRQFPAFAPEVCLAALRHFYDSYRTNLWTTEGFRDAYNVRAGWWVARDWYRSRSYCTYGRKLQDGLDLVANVEQPNHTARVGASRVLRPRLRTDEGAGDRADGGRTFLARQFGPMKLGLKWNFPRTSEFLERGYRRTGRY